jgi:DNA-binding beta-propeller fold protein YncE
VYALTEKNIWTLDSSSNKIINKIDLQGRANDMCVNPSKNQVYLSIDGGLTKAGQFIVFDGSTKQEIAKITVDAAPRGISYNEKSHSIYLANSISNSITIIDGETLKPDEVIGVEQPHFVYFNPVLKVIYVVSKIGNSAYGGGGMIETLFAIEESSGDIINKIKFEADENGFDFNPALDRVYVKETSTNTFFKLDGLAKNIIGKKVVRKPRWLESSLRRGDPLAVDRITNKVYLGDHESGLLHIFEG